MKHLNYFHPYSQPREKENSLTRAFMSLLRLCPPVRQGFYNMIREKAIEKIKDPEEFPSYHGLSNLESKIAAQLQKLPTSNRYLSVLISGDAVSLSRKIEPLERGKKAQYDGLFTIDDITFFIENKPSNKIDENQLCPHAKDLQASEEYYLYEFAVNLTWREILSYLNKLQEEGSASSTQSLLIDDFLNFVNEQFSTLNPFNKFHLCTNPALRHRRMHQLLEDITKEGTEIGWHRGWGLYIGTAEYPFMGKIGLNYWADSEHWTNNLSFVIADTTAQARGFFKSGDHDPNSLLELKNLRWDIRANFHIGFMQQNLVHFATVDDRTSEYLEYWKQTPIRQVKADEGEPNVFSAIDRYLDELAEKDLIIYDDAKRHEVERAFGGNMRRSTVNIRPGFFVGRNYGSEELEELDRKGALEDSVKAEINRFFNLLTGKNATFLK